MVDRRAAAAGGAVTAPAPLAEVREAPPGRHVEVDRVRLRALLDQETERFRWDHPRSGELADRASRSLFGGVPMSWMAEWASPYPVFLAAARGARLSGSGGARSARPRPWR
jgi:hypothetical protein